ncbi:MAG: aminotransferase class I/II-fold pyridoxal phosphate-dependent enzyme [Clostridia bacterium]
MIDYNNILSNKIKEIKPSGIRKFFDISGEIEDCVSLGIGEPDFVTPWHIRQAGIKSLENGHTHYTSNLGILELRDEISKYMKRRFELSYNSQNEILVSVGGSEAIDLALRAVLNQGDEVLIPDPSFVCYEPITSLVGAVPISIPTYAENDFRITLEDIKKVISPKTKVIVFPFPNNPTGAVMKKEHLAPIAEYLKDKNILVLSDELYSELTYNGSHTSIAAFEGMKERTIVINGFSKTFAMTGWRLGFACGPSEIIAAMTKIHQFAIMSAPTMSQYSAIEALRNGDEDVENMKTEYNQRRRFLLNGLKKLGLTCFEPEGAFYAFPSIKKFGMTSEEFCKRLLYEQKCAVIPGDAFGKYGEGYVRISYAYNTKTLAKALSRIEKFINSL